MRNSPHLTFQRTILQE